MEFFNIKSIINFALIMTMYTDQNVI